MTIQVFHIKEISGTLSGLSLAEACGEALRQALRFAWVGSKLQVPVGVYSMVAPIILEKDLEIEGACSKDTIIYNCVPIRHCLQVRGESQDTTVSIVGITLQQRRVSENIDFTTDGCHGGVCIDIRRGRVAVVSCELLSECKECVRTLGSAAFLELRDCDVKCASEYSAVAARDGARVAMRGATVTSSLGSGIEVTGRGSEAHVVESVVRSCGQRGLVAAAGAAVVLERSTVCGNRASGVLLTDAHTTGTVRQCGVSHNGMHGCSVQGEAVLYAEKNQVLENGRSGFAVTMKARARLEDNHVAANRRSGLVVMDAARAALRGNRLVDNAKCGLLCHGAGVRVCLAGDTLARNAGSGLVIQDKARALLEGLTVRDNSRFSVLVHGRAAMALLPPDHGCEAELAQLEGGEAVELECEGRAGPGWIADVQAIARGAPAALQGSGPAARIARWLCLGECVPRASLGVPGGLRQAGGPLWSDLPLDPAAPAAAASAPRPSQPLASVLRSQFRPFLAVVASIRGPAQDRQSPSTAMLGLLHPRAEVDRPLLGA